MKLSLIIIFIIFVSISIPAQSTEAPFTGWMETETEHFRIIYEEMSVNSVLEITNFCEDVYTLVTSFFQSYPEKIVLVVHDRIDISNGSYYPAPPHINIYLSPPLTPEFGAKIDNWLKFLLIHELTHYVNMTIEKGLFYGLSRVLGKSVSSIPGGLMPGWAIEGIAVKLESDFTGGGRGNNPFFEIFSKALILEDELFSWRQAAYSSQHPPLNRIYIAGYIINDYLSRKYGDDIFVKIYKAYLFFPPLGFNHYVKKITGDSISVIFASMETELKNIYSNINTVSGELLSPDTESNYYLPKITAGEWILYRDSLDKEPAIITMNPFTKQETVLVKSSLSDYKSFSVTDNGKLIYFTTLGIKGNHPAGLTATSDLYVLNRSTDKIQKITSNAHLHQPAVSPNGERLVAVQKEGQNTRLVEVEISTGIIKPIFEKKGSSVFSPDFSLDGEKLVFTVQDTKGRNIFIIDNKYNIESLNKDIPGDAYNPLFRDNGNIVFVSDMEGTPSLYELKMNEIRILKKIFTDPAGLFSGFISKNNIIYSTYTHRGYTLKTAPYVTDEKEILFQDIKKTDISRPFPQNSNLENNKKYTDLPKLVAFIPIPFYINPLYESSMIFGPGVSTYFRSILGKSEIFSTITMDTSNVQPGGSFDFTYNWGPGRINYSLLQGYLEKSGINDAIQTTQQQLIFDIPIMNQINLGNHTYLNFFTGIIDNYSIRSNMDFPFCSPDPDLNIKFTNNAYNVNGFTYSFSGQKSQADTIQPFKVSSSTIFYTPISNYFFKQFAIKNTSSINLPSLFDHQVLKLSGRVTYSEIDDLQYLNNPRGFYLESNNNIDLLTAVDYLFTISVPDWPILGGLSLQGISGSIHLEKIISFERTRLTVDENYYCGMELIFLGNYINILESAGLGIAYRINKNSQFLNSENLGIYLFIGTNSFQ
jgi:hypothetical protein